MGTVSLFPLAGQLGRLKGFYPPYYRDWFVVISTIFSILAFSCIQLSFETYRICWAAWVYLVIAAGLLALYILAHVSLKKKYGTLSNWKLGGTIVFLIILYTSSVVCLTCTFNILEQMRSYDVFRGQIITENTHINLAGANVEIRFSGSDSRLTQSSRSGHFCVSVTNTTGNSLSGVAVTIRNDAGIEEYFRYWQADELGSPPWSLKVLPTGGTK